MHLVHVCVTLRWHMVRSNIVRSHVRNGRYREFPWCGRTVMEAPAFPAPDKHSEPGLFCLS